MHLQNGSTTVDGFAVATANARKSAHYARPEHMLFKERNFNLTSLAVESVGYLLQVTSVTSQVAVSCRVHLSVSTGAAPEVGGWSEGRGNLRDAGLSR